MIISLCSCIKKPTEVVPEFQRMDELIASYIRVCYTDTHRLTDLRDELEKIMTNDLAETVYMIKASEELGPDSLSLKNIDYVYRFSNTYFKVYLALDIYVDGELEGRTVISLKVNKGGKIFEETIYNVGDINCV